MQTLDRDERSAVIAAPPDLLWRIVSDVTRTPELSPEVVACRWADGVHGPAVGARFEATNTTPSGRTFRNHPVVTAAEPGSEFAFERTETMAGTVAWRYVFEPVDGGTRVIESYEVRKPVSRIGWLVIERVYGGRDRRGALARGMEQTLERLAEVARREQETSPAP
jgi:hypothetical protein